MTIYKLCRQTNRVHIRSFTFKDYRKFAKLWKYAYPASNISDAEFMLIDGGIDPKIVQERQVAEIENKIIGVYELTHWKQFYHPHKSRQKSRRLHSIRQSRIH